MKRWCRICDQGWIRQMRAPGLAGDFYACDECDAAWASLNDLARGENCTNLPLLLDEKCPGWSWKGLEVVREVEPEATGER
jgi:hypothetical protein